MPVKSHSRLQEIVAAARRLDASDIHLAEHEPAAFRIDGAICTLDNEPLTSTEIQNIIHSILDARSKRLLRLRGEVDLATSFDQRTRLRCHLYRANGSARMAIRLLPESIPDASQLGLPAFFLEELPQKHGLLLFSGATGSGKTTALAASLSSLNERCARHILTLEDPIEYLLPSKRSRITQREIGRDVKSFDEGIHGALRADPDVLAIGELRNATVIAGALRAAETGHLVMATMHSYDAVGAVDRIIDSQGGNTQAVRAQLAAVLSGVITLRLFPKNGGGRVLATEVLIGTDAVRACIREGRTHQLPNAIATGRALGMRTMESHIAELRIRGEIAA